MRAVVAILALVLVLAVGGVVGGGQGVGFFVTAASAQSAENAPDYDNWNKVAARAESALADRRASNTAFEGLRDELVAWRAVFQEAQNINATRINTLQNQITALGTAPETQGVEPAELSARRVELNAQLAELTAPARRAQEAYSHADGLIGETDAIIRDRQTSRLFAREPSPLNPGLWPTAWRAFNGTISGASAEIKTAWASPAQMDRFRANLPVTLIYLFIALVLIMRARTWMVRLTRRVQGDMAGARSALLGFFVSTLQVILPALGLWAFVRALFSTELLGFRAQIFADGLIPIGMGFFVARWLLLRLVPQVRFRSTPLQFSEPQAGRLRRYGAWLGMLWGGNLLLGNLAVFDGYGAEVQVVLALPLYLLAGLLLYQVGQILRRSTSIVNVTTPQTDSVAQHSFGTRVTDIAGRVLIAVGVIGPVAGAIGYYSAATGLIFPTILTLGVLALVIILSGVMRDVYALLSGGDETSAREALVPILISFMIVLLSLPGLALIWGARVADLSEIWTTFSQGVQLGEARISLWDFVTFAVVFAVGYALTRVAQSTLRSSVLPKTSIDPGGQAAIVSGLGYGGIFLAALIAITTAGIDLSSLAIVAGALSVGIGFGLQNIVSNFVSGIILLIERPITEGDWIEVGGHSGTVREISVRSTTIETFNRTDVIIPNADLVSGTVTNYTRGNVIGRAVIAVGVAYGSDTKKVEHILTDIAASHPLVVSTPPPGVHLIEFGADSLNFEIRAVLQDVNYILSVKSDINHEIARRFALEGIEIPFAQRDIWLRNPEALHRAPAPKDQGDD